MEATSFGCYEECMNENISAHRPLSIHHSKFSISVSCEKKKNSVTHHPVLLGLSHNMLQLPKTFHLPLRASQDGKQDRALYTLDKGPRELRCISQEGFQ